MRVITIILALFATPAFAQGGDTYANARFGYAIAIPPGFVGQGEGDNGDGQAFAAEGKPIDLLVWGGMVMEPDFESEVDAAMGYTEEAGWALTAQTVTPRWAEFSAVQGARLLHQRLIALCDPGSYAAFRVEYSTTDVATMQPLITQMAESLRSGAC